MFKSRDNQVLLCAGLLVFLYVLARSVTLAVTHDEAYSFYNMKTFWYPEVLCTGNTHWLNSMAVKLAIWLKLEKIWQIRWFSIVSAFGFISTILLWLREEKSVSFKCCAFALLLLNPYILDYFSIARGYASGLLFQALALLFFFRPANPENKNQAFIALLFAGLSALSNFSFVYFFMAFSLLYFFRTHLHRDAFKQPRLYLEGLYVAAVSALIIRAFKFMTECSNDVVGAGTDDFKEFTYIFLYGLDYGKFGFNAQAYNLLAWPVFALFLFSALYGLLRCRQSHQVYFCCSVLLLIMLVAIFVNRYMLHIVLPAFRSNIFLFPLTALCLLFFLKHVFSKPWNARILTLLGTFLIINFLVSANLKSTFDYHDSADLKAAMDDLKRRDAKFVGVAEEVYGGFRNYYIKTSVYGFHFSGDKLRTWRPSGQSASRYAMNRFDHLILFPPYDLSYYRNNKFRLKGLNYFKETGTLIVKIESW